jgi:hypothetical protein
MKERPVCPLCVRRECANCSHVDQQINRLWIVKNLPDGECRRCYAVKEAVTEKPVRHTNRTRHQDHVDAYAAHLLIKAPKLVPQDPRRMARIELLLQDIEKDVFDAYDARKRLWAGIDEIPMRNELAEMKLRIEKSIRQWVAENSGDGDG